MTGTLYLVTLIARLESLYSSSSLLLFPVSYQIELGYIPNQFYLEESYLTFRNLPWIGELKAGRSSQSRAAT